MKTGKLTDYSKLCIHTITTKPWNIEEAAENFSKAGVKGISVWRESLDGRDVMKTGELLRNYDLEIVSLVRGGFFPSISSGKRKKAIENNKNAIDEAASIGCPMLVLVCGSDPAQSLEISRSQIKEGISILLPYAEEYNIKLAIEPLHPMYSDTRSAINTLSQANDLAEYFNSPSVGVVVDVYHLWWDPNLEYQIKRCGTNGHLFAFHICDWLSPTQDMLNDRGLMGEGCIPVRKIRGWVEKAGFTGFHEVEIFSIKHWEKNQYQFLESIKKNYLENS
ncbi:MAG: sugar phosphate isomerase/epimerase family protein [Bacteroidota bacterium]|nr:sugar phosphate isomerase/epimerase family protein [Bacteroidota bacterium]